MGLCCCFPRNKRGRRNRNSTSPSENDEVQVRDRESLKNRESTYTTTQYAGENDRIYSPISNNQDPLINYNWYYGIISRAQAHDLLRNEQNGTFLVRSSSDPETGYPYIISVKHKPPDGSTYKENYHYRIRKDENGYFTLGWNLYFKTVKDLLDYYKGKTDILKVPLKTFIDEQAGR